MLSLYFAKADEIRKKWVIFYTRPLALNNKIFGNWEILITFGKNSLNNLNFGGKK